MASTVSPTPALANNPARNDGAGWDFDGLEFSAEFDPAPAPDFFLNSVEATHTHTPTDDAQDAKEDLSACEWPGNTYDQFLPQVEEFKSHVQVVAGSEAQGMEATSSSTSGTSPAGSAYTDKLLFGEGPGGEPTFELPPQAQQHENRGRNTSGATSRNTGTASSASSQAPAAQDSAGPVPEAPFSFTAELNDNTWGFNASPEVAALQGDLISTWSPPGLEEALLNQPLDFEQSMAQRREQMLPTFSPNSSQPQYGTGFTSVNTSPMNQWQGVGGSSSLPNNIVGGTPEINWDLIDHDILKEAGMDLQPKRPAVPKIDTRAATVWAQAPAPMQAGMSGPATATAWGVRPAPMQTIMPAGQASRRMTPTSTTSWGPVPAQVQLGRPTGPASMRAGPAPQRTAQASETAWAPVPGHMRPNMEAVQSRMQTGPAPRRAAPTSAPSSRPIRMPPHMGQQYPMTGPAYPVPAPGPIPPAYLNHPPAAKPEEEENKMPVSLVHQRGKAMIKAKEVYKPLGGKPSSWGPDLYPALFSYTEQGEWEGSLRLTATDTRWYITNARRVGQRPLKIWIQHLPAQRNYRYPYDFSSKCRWDECPAKKGTILKGFYRVAFDECPHTSGRITDPFHNAGYMHLHCFEKMFDVYELIHCGLAALDNRVFPLEDRNPMAIMNGQPSMSKAFKDWFYVQDAAYRQFREMKSRGEVERRFIPREQKLWHVLTKAYVSMESMARMRMRNERQGNSLDKHGGDLDKYVADTEKRKALNKMARKRVADELDDEGESVLGEDGPRVKRTRRVQAPEPPSPALSHITVTSSNADSLAGDGEGWANDAKPLAGEGEASAEPVEKESSSNDAKSPLGSLQWRSPRNTRRMKKEDWKNEAAGLKKPWDASLRESRRPSATTQSGRRSKRRVSA